MPFKFAAAWLIVCSIFACSKPLDDTYSSGSNPSQIIISNPPGNAILIDASRDGGVWWFPQAGNFSATQPHQGKALADYLRSLGFTVTELPRGASTTWNELRKYNKVIRAGGYGTYTTQEIAAYDSLLHHSSSLLLLSDHLMHFPNAALSAHLGLQFSGAITGTVTPYSNHAINTGVSSLPYIAGSVIVQPNADKMTILGYVGNSSSAEASAAMGILHHPVSKIFFIGDINGIEQLPQPFTSNLVKWLFQ